MPHLADPLPRHLRDFRDLHAGETIVVCGCGRSLLELPEPERWVTVGVNDVGRRFQPTYLVVLNPKSQFKGDRFRHVAESRARAVFTQLDPERELGGLAHPHVVHFRLGRRAGTDLSAPDSLPYTRNSPYVAVCLAAFLGAQRIGLIGVDFTDHHFFARTGRHPLARELARIDREYARLGAALAARGIELVNLSAESRLGSLPKADARRWLAGGSLRNMQTVRTADMKTELRTAYSIAVERRGGRSAVGRCLDTLAATAAACGFPVSRDLTRALGRQDTLSIVWNGRHHRSTGPMLYCEHGWLPRSAYQLSPEGINADSHVAPFEWGGRALAAEERANLALHLEQLRSAERGKPDPPGLPERFLLVPLQMEGDTNLVRHAPRSLRRMQGLIDLVSSANPPWPLVFKQHPSDLRRKNRHLRLQRRRSQDLLYPHGHGDVHQILASGRCLGIVSVNSNVVHDGLLWDVPAVALGRGVWPRSGPGPFLHALPSDWDDLAHHLEAPEVARIREAYAAHLVRHQWTLEALGEREKVHDLLVRVASQGPVTLRTKPRAQPTIRRPLRINVVARDCGWLFEDLKRHFVAASGRKLLVMASERPRRSADRWIFLRTHEAAASPNPARTVVQIHDLFDDGQYRPGGFRSGAVRRSGAIVLTHPRQREILSGSGISLNGKAVICRPLGALSTFSVRRTLPEVFSIGWVGRPVFRKNRDVKRVSWLVDALRRLRTDRTPTRVLLVGERLEDAARTLTEIDIECCYHHRSTTPIEQYPGLYRQLDVLVVTSRLAAGPNSLFEALASGVPVVSTRTGWAPMLVKPGENGDLVDSVDELVGALRSICTERETWLDRRDFIRRSLGGATVESWVDENLAVAVAL